MGQLTLVRHAQASFFGATYDELSPLGRAQARALGDHWASHGVRFDAVYVGPRRRHHQTLALVASAFSERGLAWPEASELAELDEHQGLAVMQRHVGRDRTGEAAMHPADPGEAARESLVRDYFRRYFEVLRQWAGGALEVPEVESWKEFRARSLAALDIMCSGSGTRVAFTSGGLASSAAGWVLGLDDDRIIDLSAVLRNTALTEIQWGSGGRRLVSFNALPHVPDRTASTAV